jgi:hypothetical protein
MPPHSSPFAKEKMKKRRGHYCRICGSIKPNEAFSGKGHRNHICKVCSRLPKSEIDSIDQKEEIFNFMNQSHISKKNISRLNSLLESPDEEVAKLAAIVLDVAKVKPYKKKRLKFLAREHRDLLAKLDETGLIFAHHY